MDEFQVLQANMAKFNALTVQGKFSHHPRTDPRSKKQEAISHGIFMIS